LPRLTEADLPDNPVRLFRLWLDEARSTGLREPTATALATTSLEGTPAARMVLLKAFDDRGFVFTTDYESRKAQELSVTPQARAFRLHDRLRDVRTECAGWRIERLAP
jgi:pyridoxine/pyridoxamine 5'-phosphate oxidase